MKMYRHYSRGRRGFFRKTGKAPSYNKNNLNREDELELLKKQAQNLSLKLEELRRRIGVKKEVKKVFAVVDEEDCVGCGICYDVCPKGAISVNLVAKIDATRCTACLACVDQCPRGAIAIKYEY